jgi:hypothetical protein
MTSDLPELERAQIAHRIDGRVRIRVAARRNDAEWFARAAGALAAVPGVSGCSVSPLAASIVVHHAGSLEDLAAVAVQQGLFALDLAPPVAPAAPSPAAALRKMEDAVRAVTAGEVDLRTAASTALVALGALQLLRGQILAPAVTLFWYGLEGLHRAAASSGVAGADTKPPEA